MKRQPLLLVTAIIFLAIPLVLLGLWLYAATQASTYQEAQTFYRGWLPLFLQQPFAVARWSVACCVVAIIAGVAARKNSVGWRRAVAKAVVFFGVVLFLFYVWSLL